MVYNSLLNRQSWKPASCLFCYQPIAFGHDLCPDCAQALPYISIERGFRCCRCATLLATNAAIELLCGSCQSTAPDFQLTRALFAYANPVDSIIQSLKYDGKLHLARLMGQLWANKLQLIKPEIDIDTIVPVPLHTKRLRERGFNQSLELARPLASKLRIPICQNGLIRVRATTRQTELPTRLRANNVRGAFQANPKHFYRKRIALLDDVMTTGSTVRTIAKNLKEAGADYIEVWILARA